MSYSAIYKLHLTRERMEDTGRPLNYIQMIVEYHRIGFRVITSNIYIMEDVLHFILFPLFNLSNLLGNKLIFNIKNNSP